MKDPLRIIGTAVPAAIAVGLLWIFLNRFVPQGGAGFLERQAWPISNIYICAAIGGVLGAGSAAVAALLTHRRRQAMEPSNCLHSHPLGARCLHVAEAIRDVLVAELP